MGKMKEYFKVLSAVDFDSAKNISKQSINQQVAAFEKKMRRPVLGMPSLRCSSKS